MRNILRAVTLATLAFNPAIAGAFQLSDPLFGADGRGRQSASAYAKDTQGVAAGGSSLLSTAEIRHIKWCAARYALGYDAVNDTNVNSVGNPMKCVSPS